MARACALRVCGGKQLSCAWIQVYDYVNVRASTPRYGRSLRRLRARASCAELDMRGCSEHAMLVRVASCEQKRSDTRIPWLSRHSLARDCRQLSGLRLSASAVHEHAGVVSFSQ